MLTYIAKRLLYTIPTLLAVVLVVFILMYLVPGDPVALMLGPDAIEAERDALRKELALDRPFFARLAGYCASLFKGDLGTSFYYQQPVLTMFCQRFPNTLRLSVAAMVIAVGLSIPLGVTAAVKRDTVWDYGAMLFAVTGISVPVFFLGLLLMYVFGLRLRWLPISGLGGPLFSVRGLHHLILPSVTLGAIFVASSTRLLRASMLEILDSDYIRTARAKGLAERVVIYKHALRNALNPFVTNISLQVGALMGGAVLTESVFAWPGIGRLLVQGVYRRDYPVVQGLILCLAFFIVFVNLLTDLCYTILDPRVRY